MYVNYKFVRINVAHFFLGKNELTIFAQQNNTF